MICQTCKQDRPIRFFAKNKADKRRSRRCSSCKRSATCKIRRWHKEGRECSRCGAFRECPAEITDYPWRPAVCQTCQKAKANARTAAWARTKRATDPEWRQRQIEATLRWQERNPEKVAANHKRTYEMMMADPERHERRREDARMAYRLRREKAGKQHRPLTEEEYVKRYGHGFGQSPTVPVNEELRRLALKEIETAESGWWWQDRRLREVAAGTAENISLVTADRLCTRFGVPLNLIYPELAA